MKVLVGCEFSQAVTRAFRLRGHEAWSCDLRDTTGNPEWHLKTDVFAAARSGDWDLAVFHPPCTYLTVAANRSFVKNPRRWQQRLDAVKFVWRLMKLDIPRIAVENPQGVLSTYIGKPTQYVEPWMFGDPVTKKTGLWLKNLPPLTPTKIVEPEIVVCKGKRYSKLHYETSHDQERRLLTFPGLADSMAQQWGRL